MICLMPVTRPQFVEVATNAAVADGWQVKSEIDTNKVGCSNIRNKLLKENINDCDFIRFIDDDDIVLPCKDIMLATFQDATIDVILFDFILNQNKKMYYTGFSDNMKDNAYLRPQPWSWIARAKSLLPFINTGLFDPTINRVEGGFAFLKLIQTGLKIKHIKHAAYQWNHELPTIFINRTEVLKNTIAVNTMINEINWSK